ncbi:MAG: carboxylating nicotinate-nucleotide diphosphorylase [Clostridium sp.]
MLDRIVYEDIVKRALMEDINYLDLSSSLIGDIIISRARVTFKEDGVLCGLNIFIECFRQIDPLVKIDKLKNEGDYVLKGEDVLSIEGRGSSILKAERTALNFLQRMCGIATKSRMYSNIVKGLNTRIVDTRKTTPGLRPLEKYAVRIGGCYNHRYNLSDAIMIKDNHIKALGGIGSAIKKARDIAPHTMRVEVEVSTIDEVNEALLNNADIIMLDNMNYEDMKKAVEIIDKKAIVEVSGNINLDTVEKVASLSVDIISTGDLTHTIKSLDISLNLVD